MQKTNYSVTSASNQQKRKLKKTHQYFFTPYSVSQNIKNKKNTGHPVMCTPMKFHFEVYHLFKFRSHTKFVVLNSTGFLIISPREIFQIFSNLVKKRFTRISQIIILEIHYGV